MGPLFQTKEKILLRSLPRNVWAVRLTSFFMDVSNEMMINLMRPVHHTGAVRKGKKKPRGAGLF